MEETKKPSASVLRIVVVWLIVMGLLYAAMVQLLRPKPASVTASGELVMERARDGHFYVDGTVGGQAVVFLVDTGATSVTVSESLARAARLGEGVPAEFNTANGVMRGRMLTEVPVTAGPFRVSGLRVGVGLNGGAPDEALLGQNFLSRFDISVSGNTMTLRAKQP